MIKFVKKFKTGEINIFYKKCKFSFCNVKIEHLLEKMLQTTKNFSSKYPKMPGKRTKIQFFSDVIINVKKAKFFTAKNPSSHIFSNILSWWKSFSNCPIC